MAAFTRSVQAEQPAVRLFDAFISYSHAADGRLAPALQSGLQSLGKPWYRRRALHVFRDKTSLSATPQLWSTIESALHGSRFFILLASPLAAASSWVRKELGWWRRERGPLTLLIVLTDGDIRWDPGAHDFDWTTTTAVPRTLEGFFTEEPLWVDLRYARDEQHLALRDPRFREGIAELAAPLRGVGKDALIGEDVLQHRRTMLTARAAVAVLVLFAMAATVAGILAIRQVGETARQRDRAETEARIATSRALAGEAAALQGSQLDLALLLAVEANRIEPTTQARTALLGALSGRTGVVDYLRHHTAPVSGLAFAPDGGLLASADTEGTVVLWRVPDGMPRGEVVGVRDDSVQDIVFSPDGQVLAVGGTTVTLVETGARTVIRTLDTGDMHVDAVAYDEDGAHLAASGCLSDGNSCMGGLLKVWDVATGRLEQDLVLDPTFSVSAVAFQPAGPVLAAGLSDGSVALVDPARDDPVLRLPHEHPDVVEALAFSADGSRLTTASGSTTPRPDDPPGPDTPAVLTWDVPTGALIAPLELPRTAFSDQPLTIALDRTGDAVMTVDDHNRVSLWNLSGTPLRDEPLSGHRSQLWSADFDADGGLLATGEDDGTILLWRLTDEGAAARRLMERRALPGTYAVSVALSPDAQELAVGDADGATLLDTSTLRRVAWVESPTFLGVSAVAFRSDGRLFAAAGVDGEEDVFGYVESGTERVEISLVEVPSGRPAGPFISFPGYLNGMAFRPGTSTLAVAVSPALTVDGSTGGVVLVDTATNQITGVLGGGSQSVTSVAFNGDGSVLATGHQGGSVQLWRMPDGQLEGTLQLPDPTHVTAVALDASGEHVAAGSGREYSFYADDGTLTSGEVAHTIYVWTLKPEPRLVRELAGHAGRETTALAFDRDGTVLAAGGSIRPGDPNGPLGLWDLPTGDPLIAPQQHAVEVTGLAAALEGAGFLVAAGHQDGAALWQLHVDTWIEQACDIAGRNLTQEEWTSFLGDRPRRSTC